MAILVGTMVTNLEILRKIGGYHRVPYCQTNPFLDGFPILRFYWTWGFQVVIFDC